MTVIYMNDKDFRNWVRSVLALPFLPLNRPENAVERLRHQLFDQSSESFLEIEKFKHEFIQYIENVWIHGHFNPKIWNQWRKSRNLTNNNNEG